MLELREGDARAFFQVPFRAYGTTSLYVSPLEQDLKRFLDDTRNPLFTRFGSRRFLIAVRDGAPVGRIVAHVHRASNDRFGRSRIGVLGGRGRVLRLRRWAAGPGGGGPPAWAGGEPRVGRGLRRGARYLQPARNAADRGAHGGFRPQALQRPALEPAAHSDA